MTSKQILAQCNTKQLESNIIILDFDYKSMQLGSKFIATKKNDAVMLQCFCGNMHAITSEFVKKIEMESDKDKKKDLSVKIDTLSIKFDKIEDGSLIIYSKYNNKNNLALKVNTQYILIFVSKMPAIIYNAYANDICLKVLSITKDIYETFVPDYLANAFKQYIK